jgi:hypothetical protein
VIQHLCNAGRGHLAFDAVQVVRDVAINHDGMLRSARLPVF